MFTCTGIRDSHLFQVPYNNKKLAKVNVKVLPGFSLYVVAPIGVNDAHRQAKVTAMMYPMGLV
jgi:hypothetical protein